jgi:SAM-dependent methyltransferase
MPRLTKQIKLNLGCGANKLKGFINIDTEPSTKPDLVCNFVFNKLPYKDNSVEEVVFFHCIEHISKRLHPQILCEIWRVLKPGAKLFMSYPEFLKCVANWRTNYRGKKTFWEATLYGRQLYASDSHVCIMHTPDFVEVLADCGFIEINSSPELTEIYNTMLSCIKGVAVPKYVDLIKSAMNSKRSNPK